MSTTRPEFFLQPIFISHVIDLDYVIIENFFLQPNEHESCQ